MRVCVVGLLLLAACGSRLGGPAETPTDSANDDDGPVIDPDTQPVCKKRPLFLSFEGETLTDGVASDATANVASWMTNGITTATAPPYHTGVATRAAEIQAIINETTSRVQDFTTVTTTRPASGEYMMVVFGGTAAAMGSKFGFVQELDCGDAVRNDVAWVADGFPAGRVVDSILGSIGFGIGLTATTDPTDCMCNWDNNCTPAAGDCVFHDGIARDPTANQRCDASPQVQNEIADVKAAFCN